MNFNQVENCFDFIADCIISHGEQIRSGSDFKGYRCWATIVDGRNFSYSFKGITKTLLISGFLDVYLGDKEFLLQAPDTDDRMVLEKRLLETLMLFNGDISHKEYANES